MECQLVGTGNGLLSPLATDTKKRSGPGVLVRPQLPHVLFVQTKMMLLQKHREKKRIIVDVVLAVMEACLQSE